MDNQPLLQLDQKAPGFVLPDLDGNLHSLKDYQEHIVILNFWSAECPWSQRSDQKIIEYLQDWATAVQYFPIASNANENRELIISQVNTRQLPLMLHDLNHQVADLYGAITTPHLFVLDTKGFLRYQGAFDDVTFRQPTPTLNYLYLAVEAIRNGFSPEPAETSPYGCTIVRALP